MHVSTEIEGALWIVRSRKFGVCPFDDSVNKGSLELRIEDSLHMVDRRDSHTIPCHARQHRAGLTWERDVVRNRDAGDTDAATDLKIGSTITAASTAAAAVAKMLPASADEVSVAVAALFGTHAQEYQTVSAQVATFHDRFRADPVRGRELVRGRRGGQR